MTYEQFVRLDWLYMGNYDLYVLVSPRQLKNEIPNAEEYDSETLERMVLQKYERRDFTFERIEGQLWLNVNKSSDYEMTNYGGYEVIKLDMQNYSTPTLFLKTIFN